MVNKRAVVGLTLLFMTITLSVSMSKDSSVKRIARDFRSLDWSKVHHAKLELESMQEEAIPILLDIMENGGDARLEDTDGVVYPGGGHWEHSWIVDYDIDRLAIRAGWALEELAFEDFGFSVGDVNQGGEGQSIERAKSWWKLERTAWTRLGALKKALQSANARRVLTALDWLNNGETRCDSLTRRVYEESIYPLVRSLVASDDEMLSRYARDLVDDHEADDWYWLQSKGGEATAGLKPASDSGKTVPDQRE